jgi:16S rRNA (adenine1518-N6/adenine1519-N6)-dimethyltransferase
VDWAKIDNSPSALRSFLEREGLAPKKRWGQNFMVSPGARESVATALGVQHDDLVWEIGPGLGAITSLLVSSARQVVVFEIDHGAIRVLQERFGSTIRIVTGDAVKTLDNEGNAETTEGPDLVAGNLPYRSAAPIIAVLLESARIGAGCRRMVFTVQREMARRMVATPGQKDYSPFTVLCALTGTVAHISDLAAGSFYPVPEVVSSLVSIVPGSTDRTLLRLASLCARSLFSSRRKTIRNNLPTLALAINRPVSDLQQALDQSGISNSQRAETVPPAAYLQLAQNLQ